MKIGCLFGVVSPLLIALTACDLTAEAARFRAQRFEGFAISAGQTVW